MIWTGLSKHRELGLLLMRVGLGFMFLLVHGGPKMMGGPGLWEKVGQATSHFGINFSPTAFGLAAALAESLGGILLILGFFFRPACVLLIIIMVTAATNHFAMGQGWSGASHAIEVGCALVGLLLVGPGKYSLDRK
ncbi:MAG: DoxX family protein [Phycisphaerales bacterium]|jgi:putative oxidoreductase|nr:DoxX family protein [Phycisphaerales bacterium]